MSGNKERPSKTHKTIITRPAAPVSQGNLRLFATSLRVKDLRLPNFYRIDELDPSEGAGYQRVLNESRARRLKDYLILGHQEGEAFLPTSIFLATDQDVQFDEATNTITFDVNEIGPFNVVDGQHRIAGLVTAAMEDPELDDFEIPANIAVKLNPISQMAHFLIVNTTQRSVDKAVEQQIVARLSNMVSVEELPVLPKWIVRQVHKGDDAKALALANFLNSDPDSPWYRRIRMANDDDKDGHTSINQKSFVNSLKKYVLSSNNPMANSQWEADRQQKIFGNYWKAVGELLLIPDSDQQTVLLKTIGVDLFNMVSATAFVHLLQDRNYTVPTITRLLQTAFENLPAEYVGIGNPEWWLSGNEASNINTGGVRKLANALSQAMTVKSGGRGEALV